MKWKDIKIGDTFKDGSIVTQIHRTHQENSCKLIYDNDKEFICAYRHILLVDIHNLPEEGKQELDAFCSFVPLEESYEVHCDRTLSKKEQEIIDKYLRNEQVDIKIEVIANNYSLEAYRFYFTDEPTLIIIQQKILKSEPQKVDDNTYWLTMKGIEYLMNKYKADLYCNELLINKIIPMGKLDCFCISTDTGRYET